MTESPDSLGEPGAQPMGASWRGSPLPMARPWARTSPKNRVSTWDDVGCGGQLSQLSTPTQGFNCPLNTSYCKQRRCALINLVFNSRT